MFDTRKGWLNLLKKGNGHCSLCENARNLVVITGPWAGIGLTGRFIDPEKILLAFEKILVISQTDICEVLSGVLRFF